jgi:hypothetical protein
MEQTGICTDTRTRKKVTGRGALMSAGLVGILLLGVAAGQAVYRKRRPPNTRAPRSSASNCHLLMTAESSVAPPSRKRLQEPGFISNCGGCRSPTRSTLPTSTRALAPRGRSYSDGYYVSYVHTDRIIVLYIRNPRCVGPGLCGVNRAALVEHA